MRNDGSSYAGWAIIPRAAMVALVQFEGARAAWKFSLNFFPITIFPCFPIFNVAFSFLSRKSNVLVKCVTHMTYDRLHIST